MGWQSKLKKETQMTEAYRAVVTVRVVKVTQTATPNGVALEQAKLQQIETSGQARTPGEAVDNALADGIEEFVAGLSRVVGAVVMPGPITQIGQ